MQSVYRRSTQKLFTDQSLSLRSVYPLYSSGCGFDQNRFYSANVTVKGSGHLVRKGTGGRSSVSGIVATVFGATGFLGRYVVQQLAKMGTQVLVPFRGSEDSHRHLKLMGDLGQIVPMKYDPRDENSIKAVMAKANVVLNLIGREYETRNFSFEEVNHGMAEQLAVIAKEHGGIMRFIQVSCLGASLSSPSRMLRLKAAGEQAILKEFPEIMGDGMILHRWFSSNAEGKPTEFSTAVKEEEGKMAKTPAKPITSFSPLEAVSVKPRSSGLGNKSLKIKRTELVDKITFALIPALILTSKGSLTTSILVLSVYWQVYGFFREIFLDYVHQEVTRKWVLIYFQILLLILVKDTFLNFGLV